MALKHAIGNDPDAPRLLAGYEIQDQDQDGDVILEVEGYWNPLESYWAIIGDAIIQLRIMIEEFGIKSMVGLYDIVKRLPRGDGRMGFVGGEQLLATIRINRNGTFTLSFV